jgi:hypothetical protein
LHGGASTTRLVTTRNDSTLPANAVRQSLDAMRDSEALELIATGLPAPSTQRRELMSLAARLGEWPLLLKLVNGFLRDRVLKLRQALSPAIAAVNKRLDEKGLIAFDARNETERTNAVALTIGVSLELWTIRAETVSRNSAFLRKMLTSRLALSGICGETISTKSRPRTS